jgi:hypothetical protein
LVNKNKEELSFGTITLYMDEQGAPQYTHHTSCVGYQSNNQIFCTLFHDDIAIHASQSTFQESRKMLPHQEE